MKDKLIQVFGLPIVVLRRKDGRHAFEDRELYGFKRERVDEIWEERRAQQIKDE